MARWGVVLRQRDVAQQLADWLTARYGVTVVWGAAWQPDWDDLAVVITSPSMARVARERCPTARIAVVGGADLPAPQRDPALQADWIGRRLPSDVQQWIAGWWQADDPDPEEAVWDAAGDATTPEPAWDDPPATQGRWDAPAVTAPPARPALAATQPAALPPRTSRVIAVYAAAGGVGKSTAVAHWGQIASRQAETVLVELDEDHPGLATYWDKTPTAGLDSLREADWRDERRLADAVRGRLLPLDRGRLSLLPMVGVPEGLQCEAGDITRLIRVLRARWPVVILDLPSRARDIVVLEAISAADTVVILLDPSDVTVTDTQHHCEVFQAALGPDVWASVSRRIVVALNKVPRGRRWQALSVDLARHLVDNGEILPSSVRVLGTVPLDPERYLRMINGHARPSDPAWQSLWEALDPDRAETASAPRRRWPWARRRTQEV